MHPSVCWHTALLEDVSVTVMAQVDKASFAPHSAQQFDSMQQKKYLSFQNIVTFRSHFNSFMETNKPKWSQTPKLIFSKVM